MPHELEFLSKEDWPPAAREETPWAKPAPLELTGCGHNERGQFHDYANDKYAVRVTTFDSPAHRNGFDKCIMVYRFDGTSARDWRDLQWIKDQVVGPEVDAIEYYPRRSRVVDPSNAVFLWVGKGFPPPPLGSGPGGGYVVGPDEATAPQRGFA